MAGQVSDRILKRIYVLVVVFAALAVAIIGRIVLIQQSSAASYAKQAKEQRIHPKRIMADRGSILSENQSIMAVTLPFYRFAMDPTVPRERDFANLQDSLLKLSRLLSKHFGDSTMTPGYFLRRIKRARANGDRHIYLFPVHWRFNYQDYKKIREFPVLNRGQYGGGFIVEKVQNKRFYPLGNLARITLGRMKNDTTPTRGIEYSFDQQLRGQDGRRMVQEVAGGVEVPLNYYGKQEAKDGNDVVTTLNINMQDIVHTALRDAIKKHDAEHGVALLMESKSGEIKALANYPENYNRAVATRYEPGSTFKIASVLAALEDGFISPDDSIDTGEKGYKQYYDRTMKDEAAYGTLSLHQAIEKSSNVAISKVIYDHYKRQPQQFIQQLEQMGILSGTDFQLEGEPLPYIIRPHQDLWSGTTLPWLATGYNVKLTPLQLITFFNAIANDGTMVIPQLVQKIKDGHEVVRNFPRRIKEEQIASAQSIRQVQRMMEGVVEHGTAENIDTKAYKIAGKTGTAQKLIDGEYKDQYRASFVGYFPADNPQYTMLVMIDEPREEGFYGAEVAAPVFRRIADQVFATHVKKHYKAEQDSGQGKYVPNSQLTHRQDALRILAAADIPVPNKAETRYVRTEVEAQHVNLHNLEPERLKTPDVRGMSAKSAVALLENLGFRVRLEGQGKVIHQGVPPGRYFRKGQVIHLELQSND